MVVGRIISIFDISVEIVLEDSHIKVGDILSVRMAIANTTGASNVLYARYVDVFNLNSNIFKCEVSLNKFVNMIGTNFELEEK